MSTLFPDSSDPNAPKKDDGYVLPRGEHAHIEPLTWGGEKGMGADQAAELIRRKIDTLYASEPAATKELRETEAAGPRSKHQEFMHQLSTSGKSLAQIQTAWHEYYTHLPDDEKHGVWQEFYAANARQPSAYTKHVQAQAAAQGRATTSLPAHETIATTAHVAEHSSVSANPAGQTPHFAGVFGSMVSPSDAETTKPAKKSKKIGAGAQSVAALRKRVLQNVRASNAAQLKAKQHLQSLIFGISLGALVLVIVLFSFFNEVIITPFIQPSRHLTSTPIILSSDDISATSAPEVIIPKINLEIPVDYSLTTDDENTVENALEGGIVHYASTALPGQAGNAAFFGHSSNNIFNPGKYKFAFVLLHTLVPGDIFYLTRGGVVYTYKVYDKQVVDPSDVAVLNNVPGKTATATLITCDPPGTSLHRLVVWGEQISPDPSGNVAAAPAAAPAATQLASNGPSLWHRFTSWLF